MKIALVALALLLPAPFVSGPQHFSLTAVYVPPEKPGKPGAVAVTFRGRDPEIHVNEEPAPRLKLDPEQSLLLDRQPPASGKGMEFDPDTAHYLDLSKPVRFAVEIAPTAPRGPQSAKASVVYFYCSKREGWCRRGSTEVLIPITVE